MAAGDIILSSGTTVTASDIQELAAAVKTLLAAESKELSEFELVTSLSGLSSLPGIQQSGSTMRLVRVSLDTLRGLDGKEVELAASTTTIQWRYVGDSAWKTLVEISLLKGDKGDSPELRKGPTGIEWKYDNETGWKTLVSISDLAFKFDDLTETQVGELWASLPDDLLAEFQQPAVTAASTANQAASNANDKAALALNAALFANDKANQAAAAATAANQAAQDASAAAEDAIDGANGLNAALERLEELEDNLTAQARQQPTSMALEYPERITLGNMAELRIKATLSPAGTGSNVLFLPGKGESVSVSPDGLIMVNGAGRSLVYVIPTENTSIYEAIWIEVTVGGFLTDGSGLILAGDDGLLAI